PPMGPEGGDATAVPTRIPPSGELEDSGDLPAAETRSLIDAHRPVADIERFHAPARILGTADAPDGHYAAEEIQSARLFGAAGGQNSVLAEVAVSLTVASSAWENHVDAALTALGTKAFSKADRLARRLRQPTKQFVKRGTAGGQGGRGARRRAGGPAPWRVE